LAPRVTRPIPTRLLPVGIYKIISLYKKSQTAAELLDQIMDTTNILVQDGGEFKRHLFLRSVRISLQVADDHFK
jgi:hypothetical protein